MLPPPPASRNSSYAYRPAPSPSIDGAFDSLNANEGSGSRSYSKAGSSHAHKARRSGEVPAPTLRTPSHVRWPSHASAKSGIPGGYGEMHRTSKDVDEDEEDSDAGRAGKDSEERDMDELRAEMMGADDARRAGRSRGLEETLEELGFGAYHWRLLALCGFGWMSDNSALQCIAVILPRVQVHFNLSSEAAGLLSSATMAGMMVGAIGWGVLSDMLGRSLPFNSTLFLTAVFGIGASFAPNFPVLLGWMFMLGSAVGGSMPTDGTLFLENLPHSKQYLLTLLSVFFSLGAVLSSVVSYFLLPGHSCQTFEGCDIAGGANEGWRSVLFVLGLFNLACAFARWFLFRLKESPRYLVTNGREQEAVVALQAIATYNDTGMDITRADVSLNSPTTTMRDIEHCHQVGVDDQYPSASGRTYENERASISRYEHGAADVSAPDSPESPPNINGRPGSRTRYDAVGLGPAPPPRDKPIRAGSEFYTPMPTRDTSAAYPDETGAGAGGGENRFEASFSNAVRGDGAAADQSIREDGYDEESERLMGGGHATRPDVATLDAEKRSSSTGGHKSGSGPLGAVQSWLRGWSVQMGKLFVPRWRRTVILMWIIWGAMAFAYTMFNVWLPAVLESRSEGEGDEAIKSALTKFVLYSAAGCPGSIMGAYMIQTSLGRRKSLAICTLATGISTFIFIRVKSDTAVVVSSMFISTAATAMYAVLYGMTPETFGTAIRGTACGTSAALSRLTGVMAPVSAGFLLSISPSLPVFTSAAIFVLTAGCSLLLPFERVAEGGAGGGFMH